MQTSYPTRWGPTLWGATCLITLLTALWLLGYHPAHASERVTPKSLSIPSLGIQTTIRTTTRILEPSPDASYQSWVLPLGQAAHHSDTASFDENGFTIIGGHSIWYERPETFYDLPQIAIDAEIIGLSSDGSRLIYRVSDVYETSYEDASWLTTHQPSTLILYTCKRDLSGLVIVVARRSPGHEKTVNTRLDFFNWPPGAGELP